MGEDIEGAVPEGSLIDEILATVGYVKILFFEMEQPIVSV
jgi:hypothetical protein